MGMKTVGAILIFLLVIPMASAQELKIIYVQGKCLDYEIKIESEGLEEGCYDVKIDSPDGRIGEVYDTEEGWKSSYFYIEDGFCTDKENVFEFRAKTYEDFKIGAKIKDGSNTITTGYREISQRCPTIEDEPAVFFLASLAALLVILIGIALYVKRL